MSPFTAALTFKVVLSWFVSRIVATHEWRIASRKNEEEIWAPESRNANSGSVEGKPATNSSIISRLCLFKKSSHKRPILANSLARVPRNRKQHRIYGFFVNCSGELTAFVYCTSSSQLLVCRKTTPNKYAKRSISPQNIFVSSGFDKSMRHDQLKNGFSAEGSLNRASTIKHAQAKTRNSRKQILRSRKIARTRRRKSFFERFQGFAIAAARQKRKVMTKNLHKTAFCAYPGDLS